jgi:hypothetical protein
MTDFAAGPSRLTNHDGQTDGRGSPLEVDIPLDLKAKLFIVGIIGLRARLKVHGTVLSISLFLLSAKPTARRNKERKQRKRKGKETNPRHHILQQPRRVPAALRVGFGAQVHEVPGLVVAVAEHLGLGVVQQRHDLAEQPLLALGRQLEVEPPRAAAQLRPPAVEVFAGWDPEEGGFVNTVDLIAKLLILL